MICEEWKWAAPVLLSPVLVHVFPATLSQWGGGMPVALFHSSVVVADLTTTGPVLTIARPTILVAEDDLDIRYLLAVGLDDEGYDVVEAADGQEALDLTQSRHIDLILLDLEMPRLTGVEFCEAYRVSGGRVPVVLVTAAVGPRLKTAICACQAADYIAKPFAFANLLDVVAEQLQHR